MNYHPKFFEQSDGARESYVFGCEHRFFSDYAQTLTGVLADANWTNVLKLSEMILKVTTQAEEFSYVVMAEALQMQRTLRMI